MTDREIISRILEMSYPVDVALARVGEFAAGNAFVKAAVALCRDINAKELSIQLALMQRDYIEKIKRDILGGV